MKSKARARTKGLQETIEQIGGSVKSEDQLSPKVLQGRPVVGGQFVVVGVCFWDGAGFEASNFAPCLRDWSKRAICGHGEATVVAALELLGGDVANKVEDVARDVKKLHAKQAMMQCEGWHPFVPYSCGCWRHSAPTCFAHIAVIIGTRWRCLVWSFVMCKH